MDYTKKDFLGRLTLDYRLARDMNCPVLRVTAHATRGDAQRGTNPITTDQDAGKAWFYRAEYRIKTLLGPDRYSDPARQPVIVLVELNAGHNYPFTPPACKVMGEIYPWSPHFARGLNICFERTGKVWHNQGYTTLGHLLRHLAHLINFDEVIPDPEYGGYNREAVRYWRSRLGARPITPNLSYPSLPDWFLFGPQAAGPPTGGAASGPSKALVVPTQSPPRAATVTHMPRTRVVKSGGTP